MYGLTPYIVRSREINNYDPSREFDSFAKAFFARDNALAQFRTDIRDKGDSFELVTDLPGFKKEDIKIELNDDTMTIQAERHSEYEEKDKKDSFLRCERSYGAYSRTFDVSGIDTEKVQAEYKDGVLMLTLPKKQAVLPTARRLVIR